MFLGDYRVWPSTDESERVQFESDVLLIDFWPIYSGTFMLNVSNAGVAQVVLAFPKQAPSNPDGTGNSQKVVRPTCPAAQAVPPEPGFLP